VANWNFWIPAEPMEPDGVLIKGERKRLIHGIAATENEDSQGEEMVLAGMKFDPYLESGHLNDDHMPGEQHILGKPIEARIVPDAGTLKKGINGPAFYHMCELYDTEPGRAAWDNIQLEKDDPKRQRGFSVEGAVLLTRLKKLLETLVEDVALTRRPANKQTFAQLVKSLSASGAPALVMQQIYDNSKPSEKAAQALTGVDMHKLLWGECSHGCYDKRGRFVKGARSAYYHLVKCHSMDEDDALALVKSLASSGII